MLKNSQEEEEAGQLEVSCLALHPTARFVVNHAHPFVAAVVSCRNGLKKRSWLFCAGKQEEELADKVPAEEEAVVGTSSRHARTSAILDAQTSLRGVGAGCAGERPGGGGGWTA